MLPIFPYDFPLNKALRKDIRKAVVIIPPVFPDGYLLLLPTCNLNDVNPSGKVGFIFFYGFVSFVFSLLSGSYPCC